MSSAAVEGLDLPAVDRFLAARVPGYAGDLRAELMTGGRSNLTYRLTDGVSTWVLRRPPLGTLTPSAHDMAREYRVVAALGASDVPVAPAVALADDSVIGVPFAVVGFVGGTVIADESGLAALADDDVRRCALGLVDTLAALHAVDPASVGLADFGRAEGFLRRQVRRWYGQWERVRTRELPDVETLHARLDAACPDESGTAIVHGDFRIDNTILDPDDPARVRAIVDWEMATLGDPLADLGVHLAYRDPAFAPILGGAAASTSDRMPATADLAERYARASGRDLTDLGFPLALAYFKIAVIAEGIHQRHERGDTRGDGFATVGEATAPLAAAGLRALGGPRSSKGQP
ncbi:phosphotransferase family protein [Pseudonocardia abyssalis]|jgi:aminoglycoside phosphotransferase (APT) family kinase protein|uniref:Phosphotransferase family protein n=1 Tax=Pseudonocardia abyssalis TaxID=2792008 RepID=A0ABS6UZV6_9PSEU|nr:phosphotransferase family protein [Pseudonocardia abyssalis]MBW0114831.1 phosphotransferase family protein [Pseudonocardia abyssalis]MBW0137234.1 phosphotransferase family protein [Pseudonocardia abyssalis]